MSLNRLVMIALVLAVAAAPGCRRTATDAVAYKDEIPPPAEPLIKQLPSVGRYGGRFVLGRDKQSEDVQRDDGERDVVDRHHRSPVRMLRWCDMTTATQQFEPELAKSWDVAPDGVTWTFHLRKGAAFSDGHPMTAEDVLFSFQVAYDKNLHPGHSGHVEDRRGGFQGLGAGSVHVVINTLKPHAALLDALCQGGLSIIPKHVLEEPFQEGTFAAAYNVATPPDQLVAGGAWRLVQYVPGEKTVLGRNPYYFGFDQHNQRLPYLDEVVFLIVPDQDAADLKFRSGGLDGLNDVKPENYRWYEEHQKKGNFTLHDLGPSQSSNFLWFNLNEGAAAVARRETAAGQTRRRALRRAGEVCMVQQSGVPPRSVDGHRPRTR